MKTKVTTRDIRMVENLKEEKMSKKACINKIFVIAAFLVVLITGYALAAPPTPEKPLVIDYEMWLPPMDPGFQINKAFFDKMAALTGGAVKMQYHVAGSMGSGADSYNRVLSGITGATQFGPGYTLGVFPMFSMFDNPIRFPTAEVLSRAMQEMYELGYLDKDFGKVKILGLYVLGPYILPSIKYKATKVEDFKGLKIRCPSEGWVRWTKALGAIPVSMTSGEQYLALQKGIVDMTPNPWDGLKIYKLADIAKYVTDVSMMTFTHAIAMNKDKWNELPKEAKEYLEKNWKQNSIKAAKHYDEGAAGLKQQFLKAGNEVVYIEPAEWDNIGKLFAPIWDDYIAQTEAKGLPAKKAVNDLYRILKELGVDKALVGYTPK